MIGKNEPIKREQLIAAIQNIGLDANVAESSAELLLGYFGFDDMMLDNMLSKHHRDLFYMMEDQGILSTYHELETLHTGREFRLNYWILKKDSINKLLELQPVKEKSKSNEKQYACYDSLPNDAWCRGSDYAHAPSY